MKIIKLKSPAKLNLYLKVVGKRHDGFHELKTIFERIDLADTLRFTEMVNGKINIQCIHPQVPLGPKNLVYKVADLLRRDFGISQGVTIQIDKNIPVAAGLAGGSSNAAITLMGLNQLWRLGLGQKELVEYAKKIGSDVPFFLYDCSWALGTGRGDIISPMKIETKLWHVLVVPKMRMLTPKVYGAMNLKLTKFGDDVNILTRYLGQNDVVKIGSLLRNDLEGPISFLKPSLLKIKRKIEALNAVGTAFSGSGPSIFSVIESRKAAVEIYKQLKRQYRQVFIVKTL
ncbi:MAG: 4-(cytidine 5'-diphospho)-2-C-methyl-D-erythritol kinase [Candidatus Omnitrophica bacterium]|nr:4-(cytidine 5'-diphospho)-2-C-methyl-D-erythritol kinase [Candidatus Omnitrophota bacterium]